MRWTRSERPRLLLTFAVCDLALVHPLAQELRQAGEGMSLDSGLVREPFEEQRAEYIRASLAMRIRSAAATLCLVGDATLDDAWVRWTLAAARELGRPLLGAPLRGAPLPEALDRLAALGVEIVAPNAPAIAARLPHDGRRLLRAEPGGIDALALALRAMRSFQR